LDLGSHHEGCNERWHHTLGLQANRCRAVLPFFCHSVLYGIVYGMQKTTVYLPDDLKAAIERTAAETGRSEADLIREGVRLAVAMAIIRRYADLGLGLADASIAVLAERNACSDVLTLDQRHFRVVQGPDGRPFRLLPADAA